MHRLDLLDTVLATRGVAGVRNPLHAEAAATSVCDLVEFAAVRWSWWTAHDIDLLDALPKSAMTWPFGAPGVEIVAPFRTPHAEVVRIPPLGDGWDSGAPFTSFQERCKNRLVDAGAPTQFAHAIVGAMNEMASNAVEHSNASVPVVGAFEVVGNRWAFSVTDVGRGILSSLRMNAAFADVQDDVEAVRLAVKDGVSSTGQVGRGNGFAHVFSALVNRMCSIRFRSTSAVACWSGVSPGAQTLQLAVAPVRSGFHVHINGSSQGRP